MKEIFFNSICLQAVALIFLGIIMIMYIRKIKFTTISNKIYFVSMIVLCITGILEVIYPFTISIKSSIPMINLFICKSYIFFVLLWLLLFLIYSYLLTIDDKYIHDENGKIKKIYIIIVSLIVLFNIACVIFIPLEYLGGYSNMPYVIGGKLLYLIYIISVIGCFLIIILLSIKKQFIKNVYITPLIIVLSLYIMNILAQFFYNYQINDITFFSVLIISVFYLTVESQDFKLLDEYKKSKKDAEEANKAKNAFLVNMSHEIRTPMNIVIGYAQALINENNLTKDMVLKDMKNVTDASSILNSLIDNILDISKIENNGFKLEEKEYLLENVVFEINSFIPSKITSEELKFTIEINEKLASKYYGDAYKIYKILTYILLNAASSTAYGEVKLNIDGEKIEDGFYELKFIVSNTGHIMTKDNFEKDLGDFVSIQNVKNNLDNNKLGLIIAKELIKILGGNIEFINEKGKGTQYHFTLKQKVLDEKAVGNIFDGNTNGKTTTKALLNLQGKTAVIVDDGEVNLKMSKRSLEQYNLNIITLKSGKECVEFVKNAKVDIIFLDHYMPEMDGVATIKALHSLGIKLPPIVALTANNYDALKTNYIAQGFDEYLSKPIVFKEMNRVMKKYFGDEEL